MAIGSPRRRRREALHEADACSWFALFEVDPHPALDAMVQAVNPRARAVCVDAPAGARYAWDLVVDGPGRRRPTARDRDGGGDGDRAVRS
jgi:hypothetical protein